MTFPLPLRWRRRILAVLLWPPSTDNRPAAEVARVLVAGPFCIVRGSRHSLEPGGCFTLFHTPSQTPMFTLPRQSLCREAAAELAGLDMEWASADPLAVNGPGFGAAVEVHRKWQRIERELR